MKRTILKMYLAYCLVAAIMSVILAVMVWDLVIVDHDDIVVPGVIMPARQPLTT